MPKLWVNRDAGNLGSIVIDSIKRRTGYQGIFQLNNSEVVDFSRKDGEVILLGNVTRIQNILCLMCIGHFVQ